VPSGGKAKFIQGKEQKPLSRNQPPGSNSLSRKEFYLKQHLEKAFLKLLF